MFSLYTLLNSNSIVICFKLTIFYHFEAAMLHDILTKEEKKQVDKKEGPVENALRHLGVVYCNTKIKERHYIAKALRDSGLSREKARSYGFTISEELWQTCVQNTGKRNVGGQLRVC